MSLINDALKKAQRLRQEQEAAAAAGADGAARGGKRTAGMSTQMWIVIGVAATVLVVVSIVGTVIWVNREPAVNPTVIATTTKAAPAPKPGEASAAQATSPKSVTPEKPTTAQTEAEIPSKSSPLHAVDPAVAVTVPPPTASISTATTAAKESTGPGGLATPTSPAELFRERVATPAPAATPPPPRLPQPDPKIQNFVDALRVSGVRSSGTESRVLMNDRVYRINDIVDRSLGLKLVKVAPDMLTFTDVNGFTYTKSL